jgi:hypothetical protein
MDGQTQTIQEKALAINADGRNFGTFAEIGAGKEVARWFFHVGKASATVAESISAYDMAVSFTWGNLMNDITAQLNNQKLNIASLYESKTKMVNKAIENFIASFSD